MWWITKTDCEDEIVQTLFSISQSINEGNDEDLLDDFLSNSDQETQIDQIPINPIFESSFPENCTINSLQSLFQTTFSVLMKWCMVSKFFFLLNFKSLHID